jgi:hypothetical protein
VLRVEVAELNSRSTLIGSCTFCPVLHKKIDLTLFCLRLS